MEKASVLVPGPSARLASICTHVLSAPVFALFAIAIVTWTKGGDFPNAAYWAGMMALFIAVLPWLTSPECPLLPRMTPHTRRVLSFAGCIVGYCGAVVLAFAAGAPPVFRALALSYLGTALMLALINVFYRASGHASGVAGPVTAFLVLFRGAALPWLAAIPLVIWARLKVKGHTFWQTVVGALVAVVATWVSFRIVM